MILSWTPMGVPRDTDLETERIYTVLLLFNIIIYRKYNFIWNNNNNKSQALITKVNKDNDKQYAKFMN